MLLLLILDVILDLSLWSLHLQFDNAAIRLCYLSKCIVNKNALRKMFLDGKRKPRYVILLGRYIFIKMRNKSLQNYVAQF